VLSFTFEDVLESSGDQTVGVVVLEVAEHREGFAGTGLSVGEDGGVLTFEETVDVSSSDDVEYLALL